MAKTVFDNSMTAHVWAQQVQSEGQSSNGNFYFRDRFLYSYGSHYVVGYVAPGPLYLLNDDSSTMTTNGKHKPAAWRAIDYGRGKFENHASVPNLNLIARALDRLQWSVSGQAVRADLRKIMESGQDDWPGVEQATRIYIATGLAPAKAESMARAGAKRAIAADKKAKAEKAKAALESEARCAKGIFARDTPQDAARAVRDILTKASTANHNYRGVLMTDAKEESRDYHRAAKAAKAKGWTRIAAHCRACYDATRVELKRYARNESRYRARQEARHAVKVIRGAVESFQSLQHVREGRERYEAGATRCRDIGDSLLHVIDSPFARLALSEAQRKALSDRATLARGLEQEYRKRSAAERMREQEADRAAWLAGETKSNARVYYGGRLSDDQDGALIRAKDVTRDNDGTVTGGRLQTSWGAEVPLTHAIRAFQFLKLCRDRGQGWKANGKTVRVGHFALDRIDESGNLWAACHRINWQEVERLAVSLGLSDLAPTDSALEMTRGAA